MSHHVVSPKLYLAVIAALFVLTGVTVWVAFQQVGPENGPWNDVVALTIAVTKATLVVLFFMHVKYSPPMVKLTVVAAVLWLLFLLLITFADPYSRDWIELMSA